MAGRLIYVMGPSGSGKDTVLQGLHGLMGSEGYMAPRLVTRAANGNEPWAVPVSPEEFVRLERGGQMAMAWRAHGLAYGVLHDIDDKLAVGCDVLVNGSREYLPEACRRYPDLVPVLLTVDNTLLRRRLTDRGRESDARIGERLARNRRFTSMTCHAAGVPIFVLDNSGAANDAVRALYMYLMRGKSGQLPSCN